MVSCRVDLWLGSLEEGLILVGLYSYQGGVLCLLDGLVEGRRDLEVVLCSLAFHLVVGLYSFVDLVACLLEVLFHVMVVGFPVLVQLLTVSSPRLLL